MRRIFVPGGTGFIGRYVIQELNGDGIALGRKQSDFRKPNALSSQVNKYGFPDGVINLAASVGGIGANSSTPGLYAYENLMIGLNLLEESRLIGGKFLQVGSVCEYPKYCPVPFKESDLWSGYPEETNAPYGVAKRALLVTGQAYRKQYGMKVIHLLLANTYGPGESFDLLTSHCVGGMIRRFSDAVKNNETSVTLWGTGEATRDLLYVEDAAKAIVAAYEHYDSDEPVNIGTGKEIKIKDLAEIISRLCGFTGEIIWDKTKPDGQPRRVVDTSKATFFKSTTPIEEGLRRTVEYYGGMG